MNLNIVNNTLFLMNFCSYIRIKHLFNKKQACKIILLYSTVYINSTNVGARLYVDIVWGTWRFILVHNHRQYFIFWLNTITKSAWSAQVFKIINKYYLNWIASMLCSTKIAVTCVNTLLPFRWYCLPIPAKAPAAMIYVFREFIQYVWLIS
jgi:hypothetical protein